MYIQLFSNVYGAQTHSHQYFWMKQTMKRFHSLPLTVNLVREDTELFIIKSVSVYCIFVHCKCHIDIICAKFAEQDQLIVFKMSTQIKIKGDQPKLLRSQRTTQTRSSKVSPPSPMKPAGSVNKRVKKPKEVIFFSPILFVFIGYVGVFISSIFN